MLLKLLIFVGAAYILYKLCTGDSKQKSKAQQQQAEKKYAAGDMVKDPVCGAYVSKDSDIRVRQGEQVKCFCSYQCRDRYLKEIGTAKDD